MHRYKTIHTDTRECTVQQQLYTMNLHEIIYTH